MKAFLAMLVIASSIHAGFFKQDESKEAIETKKENQRLCKLFTEKAEVYKKTMREDELAQKTLQSYEKRANIYCMKS